MVDADVDGEHFDLLAGDLLDVNESLAVNVLYLNSYGGRLKK